MNKTITANQTLCMILLSSLSMKISILPAIMSTCVGSDIWLILIGISVIEFVSFFCIIKVAEKNPDKTFFQILGQTNKTLMKFIEILFISFFIFKTILSVYETKIFIKTTIYEEFNDWIFIVTFLGYLFYISTKDSNILGRMGEIVIYSALIGCFISLMLSILEIDITAILPIFKNELSSYVYCIKNRSFWFGDYLIFLFLMGSIKFEDSSTKRIMISYILMSIFLILFFLTFVCLFENTTSIHLVAISDVGHYFPRFNDFRLDWVSDIAWIIVDLYATGVYFYISKVLICDFIKVKNKNILVPIVLCFLIFTILNVFQIPLNKYINFIDDYLFWLPIIIFQLPIIIIICNIILRRRKRYEYAVKE